jgi:hypothetical protein
MTVEELPHIVYEMKIVMDNRPNYRHINSQRSAMKPVCIDGEFMPTGYTYAIEEGCSFEEFVWGCARAFGACIMMRDDPADKPVPDEFQPSDYHSKAGTEAEKELERLGSLTKDEIEQAIKTEREEVIAENTRRALENDRKKARYKAMQERVKAWEPPSSDHVEMKKFMLQQIEISLPEEPYQQPLPLCNPVKWLAEKKAKAQRDLAYHHKEYARELERTQGRNEWIRQLRVSIPQPIKKAA